MKAEIPDFTCNNCGICCKKYVGTLGATYGDMKRWMDEERDDILERTFPLVGDLTIIFSPDEADDIQCADLWFTKAGNEHQACPWWHRSTGCRINDTKPKVCDDYPHDLEQATQDKCEGLP